MAKMEFDAVDAALTVALMVSGFIMVGIAEFSLFGIDFGATAFSVAGTDLSTAYIMSVGAIGGTLLTNDNAELNSLAEDVKSLDDYYMYAIGITAAVMLAWVFIPDVASFFQSEDLWGLAYVGIVGTAQFSLGWML